MERETTTKQTIYNLIILDESGSMSGITHQTITGCNETIDTIKAAAEKFSETQEHFVSIFAFQCKGYRKSRYILKNVPAKDVKHITNEDYEPSGCTPLNDAVGSTLTDLEATVKDYKNELASVTIITDGYENASQIYSLEQVRALIKSLKEMGWNFNFIGANIDAQATARSYNIDNHLQFEQSAEGTKAMFRRESSGKFRYLDKLDHGFRKFGGKPIIPRELIEMCIDAGKDYYTQDNEDAKKLAELEKEMEKLQKEMEKLKNKENK